MALATPNTRSRNAALRQRAGRILLVLGLALFVSLSTFRMRFPLFRRQPPPQARPKYLVVGLGNPGREYEDTRHNVGFKAVEALAREAEIDPSRVDRRALVGHATFEDVPVLLVRPITFMNLSGDSVAPLMEAHDLDPAHVLVITDDLDLPLGRIRIRAEGSPGGHNGLKSLTARLGTEEFPRIRIGIGRPATGVSVVDHVLSRFDASEQEPMAMAIQRAADAAKVVVTSGLDAAMREYNGR